MGDVVTLPQTSKMGKLPPRRIRNIEVRSREYLTPAEVDALRTAAGRTGRHRHRDSTFVLISYRHAGRVTEMTAMRRDQVDLGQVSSGTQ